MKNILNLLYQLNPFWQGLAGSMVFALIVIILRLALNLLVRFVGRPYMRYYSWDILVKHWIHKKYVGSDALINFSFGHFLILTNALRSILLGVLSLLLSYLA